MNLYVINTNFPYFIFVTGASSLHNFQEVDTMSFPAHIFARRLIPPPHVLLHSPQSPACHLYWEGHGFMLQFFQANSGASKYVRE